MKTMILALTTAVLLAACSKGASNASVQGPAGQKLTLNRPHAVTLLRGGTAKTDLTIARVDTPGEVAIGFSKLPKGVTIVTGSKGIASPPESTT